MISIVDSFAASDRFAIYVVDIGRLLRNHIPMQDQPPPVQLRDSRSIWVFASILSGVFNYFFFFAFFDKIESWMVRGILEAMVASFACSLIMQWARREKSALPHVIILSFCVVIIINYIEYKIHEFNNPNSEKWAALGLFFAPFYVAPTIFGVSLSMGKFFRRI